MNRLAKKLQEIKERKRIGLMTHVVIGYPSIEETIGIVKAMAQAGSDVVELQIPFSDPLADGPTIMRACEISLKNDTKVADAFSVMQIVSKEVSIPLLFMSYYNTVFRYGVENFCKASQKAGASGLIIPDMPIDEESHEHFFAMCEKYGLAAIHVISPVSTDIRLQKNAEVATGFIYCTARQGTTGVQSDGMGVLQAAPMYVERIKKYFDIPIAVGFGISTKEQVQLLEGHADIAVIGSAIIDIINKSSKGDREKYISDFIKKMVE